MPPVRKAVTCKVPLDYRQDIERAAANAGQSQQDFLLAILMRHRNEVASAAAGRAMPRRRGRPAKHPIADPAPTLNGATTVRDAEDRAIQ